jgi:hypothetical protein
MESSSQRRELWKVRRIPLPAISCGERPPISSERKRRLPEVGR